MEWLLFILGISFGVAMFALGLFLGLRQGVHAGLQQAIAQVDVETQMVLENLSGSDTRIDASHGPETRPKKKSVASKDLEKSLQAFSQKK